MEKCAFFKILIHISLGKRFNITGNITFSILKYIENGGSITEHRTAGSYVFSCITDPLAVVNKYTGGVGVVIKVSIHTTDDVVSEIILVILCHFGKLLVRPVSLIFKILIDLIVSGNDGYVGIRRVNFNNMKNLSASTGCVVKYDFGLNSCTGNEYVILLRDYVVVAVCTEACTVENNVVLFPIRDGSKNGHREHTDNHHNCDYQGHCAFCDFSHSFFLSAKTYFYYTSVLVTKL